MRRHGIQAKFLLVVAPLLIASIGVLGVAMLRILDRTMQTRLEHDADTLTQALHEKGHASSNFLARIAPQAILSYDFLLLEAYVAELTADDDIAYAVIFDPAGTPLTHHLRVAASATAASLTPVTPGDFRARLSQARADPSLLIARHRIVHNGINLGDVEIALSTRKLDARAAELHIELQQERRNVAILTAALIVTSFAALIVVVQLAFGRIVMRPVRALTAQIKRFESGDLSARVPQSRADELGGLSRSFNMMAGALESRVAELRAQHTAFKATRDYLASILDNTADIIITTGLDGGVVAFNAAAERLLRYSRQEIGGQPLTLLFAETPQARPLYPRIQAGDRVEAVEVGLRRRDGHVLEVSLSGSPLLDHDGRLVGAVWIARDLTHAKALRLELVQSEKMASIGQVAAWIAHQIRNALGSISMAAATLVPHRDGEEPSATYRQLVLAIHRLDQMVADLLEYSRTLDLHLSPVNLNSMLDSLVNDAVGDRTQAPIAVETAFDPEVPPLAIDVFKLEQAFGNVLRNAVQAMPDGGTLRVETHCDSGGDLVLVNMEDTGPGIPDDDSTKVFRPFFTSKPGGTGLGLAITARIVEAHGGTVSAANAATGGAVFTIILPVSSPGKKSA